MIQEFIDRFMASKPVLEAQFRAKHPDNYKEIVKAVIGTVAGDDYNKMDVERIHELNDGDYQGTLVYVIGAAGYQPDDYWYVKVSYGSCSGCDTLEGIREYSSEPPTDEQVRDYMTLALHVVQGLKKMGDEAA